MRLIGLHGRARSGKDSAARFLAEHGYQRLALADPLKDAAAIIFGVPRADFEEAGTKEAVIPYWQLSPRQMAQYLGTDAMRKTFGDMIWIRRAQLEINRLDYAQRGEGRELKVAVTDIRFPNEAEWIREQGGRVIQIIRPTAKAVNFHVSENPLPSDLLDEVIYNDGTLAQFREKVLVAAGFTIVSHPEG